ncbi:MAG TPA: hypothetical protein DCE80_07325 [Ignavibacteriales bacterium]|nr:MAG: hypothetical protein A2X08_05450 [Bacteroidetes bacterium GWA2_32_17]HAB51965.1 hypothetical protein [Ignavibacteriales bacterium]
MSRGIWVYNPSPAKLNNYEKAALKEKVQDFIKKSEKLSKAVNRVEVKAGRIYLYQLVEQSSWDDPDAKWLKPLIDGKYLEFPYARITVLINKKFSVDWQRHTGQWVQLAEEDSLIEALKFIDDESAYFQ